MTTTLNDNWADLPASGNDAYLAQKGAALDSYRAWRQARNLNYLLAARAPQVLAAGNHNADYGTYASVTSDTYAIQTASGYLLRHRGRAVVWPPHHYVDIKMVFRAAAEGSAGSVKLWVCDQPLIDDLSSPQGKVATAEVAVSVAANFTTAHTLTVSDAPVAPDGLVYLYVGLDEIDKWGSWCIYREAISV